MKKKARKLVVLLLIGVVACLLFGCETTTKELEKNDTEVTANGEMIEILSDKSCNLEVKITMSADRKTIEILSNKDCSMDLNLLISADEIMKTTVEKRIYLEKGKKETFKVDDFVEAIGFPESAIFSKINYAQTEKRNFASTIIFVTIGVAIVILIAIAIKKEIKRNCKVSE